MRSKVEVRRRGGSPPAGSPHIQAAASDTRSNSAHLAAIRVTKTYRKAGIEIPVLRGVDLEVQSGEFVSIIGQSGSGKSTLLHLLGLLDVPDSGEVRLGGQRIDNLPMRKRDWIRNQKVGMIFQFYHLLPELSALENVLSPLFISEGIFSYFANRRRHVQRATELLEQVGLGHRLKHRPGEMSGGEMQRAAIARALAANPQVILADEPTGNLDSETGREILRILRTLNDQQNVTIIMVTHDRAIAAEADRTMRLARGSMEVA
jgi:lipoprotein-releasing system ATP-binding protein